MKGIGRYFRALIPTPAHLKTSVSQSVKDVLQSLVDDGLVQADKIGSSNCGSIYARPFHSFHNQYSLLEFSIPKRRYGMIYQFNSSTQLL